MIQMREKPEIIPELKVLMVCCSSENRNKREQPIENIGDDENQGYYIEAMLISAIVI